MSDLLSISKLTCISLVFSLCWLFLLEKPPIIFVMEVAAKSSLERVFGIQSETSGVISVDG